VSVVLILRCAVRCLREFSSSGSPPRAWPRGCHATRR
jgi:hypothetical protein